MRIILLTIFCSLFVLINGYSQSTRSTNLVLTQTVSAGPYFPNNLVYFTITARNAGPDDATHVVLTHTLSTSLTFMSASAATGTYDRATGTYTIGNLANGASVVLTFVAKINVPVGGKFRNTATVTGAETDPAARNNTVTLAEQTITTAPATATDLILTKSIISTTAFQTGQNIIYNILTANQSQNPATGVSITDVLPPNLTFVSASVSTGSFASGTGIHTVGNLAAGASATLTITATINTSGSFANIASVTSTSADRDNTNNADTVQICVLPDAPTQLEINGSALTRLVCAGKLTEIKVPVVSGATTYNYTLPVGFTIRRQLGSIIEVIPGATGGTISVTAANNCGTSAVLSVPVSVVAIPAALVPVSGNATPCSGSEVVYEVAPVTGAAFYSWQIPGGWAIISGETTTAITLRAGVSAGNITVKAANTCGDGSTQTIAVNPIATPVAPVIADSSSACAGLRYVISPVPNATTYNWTVPTGWTIENGQGTTAIQVKAPDATAKGLITVTAQNGDCVSPGATYTADASLGNGLLDFPNAFSPNGDNQNDKYEVLNLLKYPDNDIVIVNRWGNQVFKQTNYQNNWDAKGLADGTYYYVLRVKACDEQQKVYRGYITIAR